MRKRYLQAIKIKIVAYLRYLRTIKVSLLREGEWEVCCTTGPTMTSLLLRGGEGFSLHREGSTMQGKGLLCIGEDYMFSCIGSTIF